MPLSEAPHLDGRVWRVLAWPARPARRVRAWPTQRAFRPPRSRRPRTTSPPTTTSMSSAVDKSDPSQKSGRFKPRPVDGADRRRLRGARTVAIEDLIGKEQAGGAHLPDACVEGWSMVIPWIGLSAEGSAGTVKPTAKPKFVAFETVMRPYGNAGPELEHPGVDLSRGLADRRGDDTADPDGGGAVLRRAANQTARRCGWSCREVRLHGREIDRSDQSGRENAGHLVEQVGRA